MEIRALLPLSRILALITQNHGSARGGGEPGVGAEAVPNPGAAQPPPLASVQMMVMLAAVDPQRERRRGTGGSARTASGEPDEPAMEPAWHEEREGFVLPTEQIGYARPSLDPALAAGAPTEQVRTRRAAPKLDIEV